MTIINAPGFVNAIGNTPLIKLHSVSELTGCDIFGKAEFMNPGGSVKDRAAKAIVEDAEARGLLGPGLTDFHTIAFHCRLSTGQNACLIVAKTCGVDKRHRINADKLHHKLEIGCSKIIVGVGHGVV